MKEFYIHKAFGAMAILLLLVGVSACCHEDRVPTPAPVTMYSTHIIYMAAENSLSGYVNDDKAEIEQALAHLPDSSQVVVYVDDATSSRVYAGKGGEKQLKEWKVYGNNMCSTDSAEMELVLRDIISHYPAHRYTLTLWSHGSGWGVQKTSVPKTSFGVDNGRRSASSDIGSQMNIPTLARVLSHFPHFDMILFDACFMQCIEVAYEMKECTDYIIGSSAEIPGYGAPYDSVLIKMDEGSAIDAAKVYVNAYADKEVKGVNFGIVLSVIKTDELDSLASVSKSVNTNVFFYPRTAKLDQVQVYNKSVTGIYTEYYDLNSLLNHQVGYCITNEAYQQWLKAAKQAIPYHYQTKKWASSMGGYFHYLNVTDSENCMAVSVFVPTENYKSKGMVADYHQFKWYTDAGMNATGW